MHTRARRTAAALIAACWSGLPADDRRFVARIAPDLAAVLDKAAGQGA